jgi:hypothetical protein
MSKMKRLVFVCLLALGLSAVTVSAYAASVPPVKNLRLVSGSASQVKIAWGAPSYSNVDGATIDKYIIKRNGNVIKTLEGLNGLVETSYVDSDPSTKDATYSVIAVDSNNRRSPPKTLDVPAPEGAAPPPKEGKDPHDGIQSSSLCESIISPDVRGGNRPTALEKYGCGKGLSTVHYKGCGKVPIAGVTKCPQNDFFQSVLIQLPVNLGQTFFLLISALSVWVMLPGTYTGIAKLFGSILQAFNGNEVFPALISLALSGAVLFLAYRFLRDQIRRGYETVVTIAAVLAILTLLMANPFRTMRKAVDWPLNVFANITNELTDLISATDVSGEFNLTVKPTYSGNITYTAIRKAENIDFLMYQYLPQCAMNFKSFNWVMTHRLPDSNVTYCERFVQVQASGNEDDINEFEDALEKNNKDIYEFYQGEDQGTRMGFSILKSVTLTLHNMMKFTMKMSIYLGILLILLEILMSSIWLIYSMFGSDSSRETARRRVRSILHWFRIPAILLIVALIQNTVEAYIISGSMHSGFAWLTFKELIWDVFMLVVMGIVCFKLHNAHKEAMGNLQAYRENNRGLQTAAVVAGAAATGVGLAGAGAIAGAKGIKSLGQKLMSGGGNEESQDQRGQDTPFDFNFRNKEQPALPPGGSTGNGSAGASGSNPGTPPAGGSGPSSPRSGGSGTISQLPSGEQQSTNGAANILSKEIPAKTGNPRSVEPHYDFVSEAEEIHERPQIEQEAQSAPKDTHQFTTGSQDDNQSRQESETKTDESDKSSPYDGPVYDAEFIEDDETPEQKFGDFRTPGDSRF